MASQGPNNPGTAATVDGANTAWTNVNNIKVLDGSLSEVDITSTHPSQYLQGTNYGFSIPVGATINGIVVNVARDAEGIDSTMTDKTVELLKGGVLTGSNKADTVNTWIATPVTITYGGVGDLWGTTWSVAEINAIDFGLAFQIQSNDTTDFGNVGVDNINITVYYTPAAANVILAWTVA